MNIYFLAVAVKQTFKSEDKYLVKVACTLLSLMNETAPYDSADNQSVESLIDSQDVDADHGNFVSPANKSSPPTFYTMLLFHRAFCEYAFNDSFGFLLRNDPYYGKNTFGQVARLMPERVAVMYQRLQELKGGKWKHVSWKMQKKSKKDLLRSHETRKIMLLNNFSNFNDTKKATTAIEPVGPMLLEKLNRQRSANEQSES